jgi:hypothetical protein
MEFMPGFIWAAIVSPPSQEGTVCFLYQRQPMARRRTFQSGDNKLRRLNAQTNLAGGAF